jgi:hypothetical protein
MTSFFVGWSGRTAMPLLGFLALLLVTLIVGFGALAFALGVTVDDREAAISREKKISPGF